MTTAATAPIPLLIVDDHGDTRDLLLRAAHTRGLRADAIATPATTVARIERNRASVVVLDQSMPGLTGLDVLRAIRSDPRTADVRVIFYTAAPPDPDQQDEAQSQGADAWLIKSADALDKLLDTVQSYLTPIP